MIKVIDNFLTKDECQSLLNYSLNHLNLIRSKIIDDGESVIDTHRKSSVAFNNYENFKFLNKKVLDVVIENVSVNGYELVFNERGYQFTSYNPGEYYNWHTDNSNDRYCSVVIQLNDDYEGGDLELVENGKVITFKRGVGNAVVFLSEMNHRVTEVLSGTRYSLVNWLKLKQLKDFKKSMI